MRTIWLNLGNAAFWIAWLMVIGRPPLAIVVAETAVVLIYSFIYDWNRDSAAYRAALAEAESDDEGN